MGTEQLATTERGNQLQKFTEADVELGLRLLILSGGDVKNTINALADEGVVIQTAELRYWRDVAFPTRYNEIRRELANDVGEQIAGRALERATQIADAEDKYVEQALAKVDEVPADKLAPNALALARAKSENVTTAQLLRNRPTEIVERRDTTELLELLNREGVLLPDPRLVRNEDQGIDLAQIIDAQVVDEEKPPAKPKAEG